MVDSITQSLGSGSGINISELVGSLVDAQYASKNQTLTARADTLTAQISAVGELKSGISGFAQALASLVGGGTLATQPTSSDPNVVRVTKLATGSAQGLSATIAVRQLATIQSASTSAFTDREGEFGTGTLTLTFGTATVSEGTMTAFEPGGGTPLAIAIDETNDTLDGIAAAITAAARAAGHVGLTASVLSDADGARLVVRGATGASQGFTLEADGGGLSALAIGPGAAGTTIGSAAQDAIVAIDGVPLRRASNSINNLIDGVRLDLVAVSAPDTSVTLGSSAPTTALRQAVDDVVATYNELLAIVKEQTDPVTGSLRGDPAAQQLLRSMRSLTLTQLLPPDADGNPTTLAEIGVRTNRDGTLAVDAAQLGTALTRWPDRIEAMFAAGSGATQNGLSGALSAIAAAATGARSGLGASEDRYEAAQERIEDQQQRALDEAEATRTRLTQQFASMDARVAAYRSTQSFLEQQIDAWNGGD